MTYKLKNLNQIKILIKSYTAMIKKKLFRTF